MARRIGKPAKRPAGIVVEDPSKEWRGMPACENRDDRPHRCVHVYFANQRDVEDFEQRIGQGLTPKTKYIWHPKMVLQHPSRNPYVS